MFKIDEKISTNVNFFVNMCKRDISIRSTKRVKHIS